MTSVSKEMEYVTKLCKLTTIKLDICVKYMNLIELYLNRMEEVMSR